MHCVGALELIMSSHKRDALGSDTVLEERATMIAVNVNADSRLVNGMYANGLRNRIG